MVMKKNPEPIRHLKDGFVIANGYGTTNVGDIALLLGTVELLKACDPPARISALSWSFKDPSMCGFLADLERAVGGSCEFLGAVIPGNSGQPYLDSSRLRRILIALQASWSNLGPELASRSLVAFRLLQRAQSSGDLYQQLPSTRLVVLRGCNLVVRKGRLRDILALRRAVFPLLLAQQAGVPTAVLNVTVGPLDSAYASSLIVRALSRAQFVSCREEGSYQFMRVLGIEDAQMGADSAFLLESPAKKTPSRMQVAVNILSPAEVAINSPNEYTYDRYVSEFARALDAVVAQLGVSLLFVPHESSVFPSGNDLPGINMILENMNSRSHARVAPVTIQPQRIIDYYSECELLVGCRYHGVVLGAIAGVPAVNIDFGSTKVRGVAKLLGVSEYLVGLPITPGQLVESVRMCLSQSRDLKNLQVERVRALRDLAGRRFSSFVNSLADS